MILRWMVATIAVLMPAGLAAQTPTLDALATGTRLRVTAECTPAAGRAGRGPSPNRRDRAEQCRRYQGNLERVTADSLVLASDGRMVTLARPTIRSVQARMGTRGSADIGAALGGAVGLGAGVAAGVGTASSDCSPQDPFAGLCDVTVVGQVFAGAAIGAGAGALIGILVRRDRWVPVALGSPAPGAAAQHGGIE
jgi:hypothetical protein